LGVYVRGKLNDVSENLENMIFLCIPFLLRFATRYGEKAD